MTFPGSPRPLFSELCVFLESPACRELYAGAREALFGEDREPEREEDIDLEDFAVHDFRDAAGMTLVDLYLKGRESPVEPEARDELDRLRASTFGCFVVEESRPDGHLRLRRLGTEAYRDAVQLSNSVGLQADDVVFGRVLPGRERDELAIVTLVLAPGAAYAFERLALRASGRGFDAIALDRKRRRHDAPREWLDEPENELEAEIRAEAVFAEVGWQVNVDDVRRALAALPQPAAALERFGPPSFADEKDERRFFAALAHLWAHTARDELRGATPADAHRRAREEACPELAEALAEEFIGESERDFPPGRFATATEALHELEVHLRRWIHRPREALDGHTPIAFAATVDDDELGAPPVAPRTLLRGPVRLLPPLPPIDDDAWPPRDHRLRELDQAEERVRDLDRPYDAATALRELVLAGRLPPPDVWTAFLDHSDDELVNCVLVSLKLAPRERREEVIGVLETRGLELEDREDVRQELLQDLLGVRYFDLPTDYPPEDESSDSSGSDDPDDRGDGEGGHDAPCSYPHHHHHHHHHSHHHHHEADEHDTSPRRSSTSSASTELAAERFGRSIAETLDAGDGDAATALGRAFLERVRALDPEAAGDWIAWHLEQCGVPSELDARVSSAVFRTSELAPSRLDERRRVFAPREDPAARARADTHLGPDVLAEALGLVDRRKLVAAAERFSSLACDAFASAAEENARFAGFASRAARFLRVFADRAAIGKLGTRHQELAVRVASFLLAVAIRGRRPAVEIEAVLAHKDAGAVAQLLRVDLLWIDPSSLQEIAELASEEDLGRLAESRDAAVALQSQSLLALRDAPHWLLGLFATIDIDSRSDPELHEIVKFDRLFPEVLRRAGDAALPTLAAILRDEPPEAAEAALDSFVALVSALPTERARWLLERSWDRMTYSRDFDAFRLAEMATMAGTGAMARDLIEGLKSGWVRTWVHHDDERAHEGMIFELSRLCERHDLDDDPEDILEEALANGAALSDEEYDDWLAYEGHGSEDEDEERNDEDDSRREDPLASPRGERRGHEGSQGAAHFAADDDLDAPGVTIRREEPKIGRNDPCPCGSGKKYKKCCGR